LSYLFVSDCVIYLSDHRQIPVASDQALEIDGEKAKVYGISKVGKTAMD
jgi:hypothetical protein